MAIEAIEAIGEEGPARSSGAFSCSEGERGAGGGREAGISSLSQQAKKQKRSKPAQPSPAQASIDSTTQPSRTYERRSSQAWSSLAKTRPSVSRPSWWFNLRSPLPPASPAVAVAGLAVTGGWTLTHGWPGGRCYNGRGSSEGTARARRHWAVNAPTSHRGLGAGRLMM